jgi:6-pyruvoyltetrahydropterin/6-carboxytetrahydropterin synthase
MAHRLSKNNRACQYLHGHNIIGKVTVKSEQLNNEDMVMDFYDLKKIISDIINSWDHGLFLNKHDKIMRPEKCKLFLTDCDPTSEALCKVLFNKIEEALPKNVEMHSITLIEAEGSEATYTR